MPTYLLIGIPIVVVIILWGIMSLPDEEIEPDMKMEDETPKASPPAQGWSASGGKPKKFVSKKKKK